MRSGQSGVTLIELMVVVVIVGILTAIAYPSYRQQVLRSKRADAKIALQQNSQELENCFTRFHAYNDAACAKATALQSVAGVLSADGNYKITATTAAGVADLGDLAYTLTATPQAGQTADTACASFSLTATNVKTVSGSKGATPAGTAECWR